MIRYALVAIPSPLERYFTYSFDDSKLSVMTGIRVMVPFGPRKVEGYVVDVPETNPNPEISLKSIIRAIDKEPLFGKAEIDLALWMEKFYFCSRGEAFATMIPSGKRDTAFAALGAEEVERKADVVLTESQRKAVETVMSSDVSMFYLFGVTGSGKTEVFLNCAEQVIKHGKQVIYLVPEITLTHQLTRQVISRFGEGHVAILHSALSPAQRITQWRRIRRGEVNLVIGARSAVFAPCTNLGLIIIDEEHENSYKSGNTPRYHARQIAQKRITQCNAKLVMGSATPSLESWQMMKDPTKMIRIDLPQRAGGGSLPSIKVVDVSKEKGIFSQELQAEIMSVLAKKRQVILFLNRRGYNYYFHCRNCGFELKCPHCDVSLTYHKSRGELVCHYCGYKQKPIFKCPDCGSADVLYSGFGTEMVEQQAKLLFPSAVIQRLDTDKVSSDRSAISSTLDAFREGKIDILLGTQMVAKGLNFPKVDLVGIIMADSGLAVPDFRAQERTFDLLVQVSGRSGRADSKGKVLIQACMVTNPAITYASAGEVEAFYEKELQVRKETGFPPFSRMINLVVRSTDQQKASSVAENLAKVLEKEAKKIHEGDFVEVFGANECPIEKIARSFRFQVLLRSKSFNNLHKVLEAALQLVKIPSSVYLEVDVDPVNLL